MEQQLMTKLDDPDALPQPLGEYKPVDQWQAPHQYPVLSIAG